MAQFCSFPALFSVTLEAEKNTSLSQVIYGFKSHKNRPNLACLASKNSETTVARQSANYKPTAWSYDFVQSLKDNHIDQAIKVKAKKLEEDVKSMITNEEVEVMDKLELIDDIQRLGLGYKFENEIKRALTRISCVSWIHEAPKKKSLRVTALCFRLLRQHGYEISQDVFKSFMDDPKTCLFYNDVEGMLHLHEASHFGFEGESLIDEAKALTRKHLKEHLIKGINGSLAEKVSHELELPLHHRMLRLEARRYVEAYGKRSDKNPLLLEDSKLDFNMVQSTLQSELKDMSRWWKEIGLANKLSFTRDRLMECFFWTVGMVFEPQHSSVRKGLTKVTSFITVIDDIYDVYGTVDELQRFTSAVERWDINSISDLPDYMRICFLALYNTINDLAYDTLKDHDQYILSYLTKAWSDMCKAFLKEKKWSEKKETPTFQEYLENGWVSVSGVVILIHTYFLITKNITIQGLESLENCHNLLRWPSVIFRLCNDLGTSKAELERGETASSILCIMRENGVSEELARGEIKKLVEENWKKMNKDIASKDCPFEKPFVESAMNLARIAQCTYHNGDAHGAPDSGAKNRVLSLLIHPIH